MTGRRVILIVAAGGLVLGLVPAVFRPSPMVIWNATASAPEGLYRLRPSDPLHVGQWVAVAPPPALSDWLARRDAAPKGVLLIKRVAALSPSLICWSGGVVRVDGQLMAIAQTRDRNGRPLPILIGCRRVAADQVFLLNAAPGSLDGRYFGPLPRSAVIGQVTPIWVTDHEG